MLSKVSSTFGLSSASMAASDSAFSKSSSSSISPSGRGSPSPPSARRCWRRGAEAAAAPPRPAPARQHRRRCGLGLGAFVGGLEIDDVAQQDLGFLQLVAPDDDGLEGQRAFAQAGDHRLAAGLDALGDGDLALAREQLDRAHVAQVHAHGVVGALGGLGAGLRDGRHAGGRDDDGAARLLLLVAASSPSCGAAASSGSSLSTTVMPMSDSIDMVSSIWSEDTSSEGSTALSSSRSRSRAPWRS